MSYGWREIGTQLVELCDECGFDARLVTDEATELDRVFVRLLGLAELENADVRPEAEVFSAQEYVEHCVELTNTLLDFVVRVTDIENPGQATNLGSARSAAASVSRALDETARRQVFTEEYPFEVTVEWIVRHLLHDLGHHVLDIRRGYARLAMAQHPEIYTITR